MKFLIVGLGNPGSKYESTRHNIGFKALDYIAKESNVFFTSEKYGEVSSFKYKGKTIFLLKPNTFMNLSGTAVRYWLIQLKIDIKNLLVLTDDLNLSFGSLRMKRNGSDGGHNGLKDIHQVLSTNLYPRLRIGVGNSFSNGKQIDYVLGKWTSEEEVIINDKLIKIKDMTLSFCFSGIENTMNTFNNT